MNPNINVPTPKVFISYSWTNGQHIAWVTMLAKRLYDNGVEVLLDQWDLKHGHDMHKFMETIINEPGINRVLIICDKKYTEKANERQGGVGIEAQIISPGVYENASQEKFIPIFTEADPTGNLYRPTYLGTRFGIDFSNVALFEEKYEELIRLLFDRPASTRPALGRPPAYLFEERPARYKTSLLLQRVDSTINTNPERIDALLRDFLDEFLEIIKAIKVRYAEGADDATIATASFQAILDYTPARDEFVTFMDQITRSGTSYDIGIIIRFLEQLLSLHDGNIDNNPKKQHQAFINYELFVLLTAVLLKNENYAQLADLLYTTYHYSIEEHRYEKSFRQFKQLAVTVRYYWENVQHTSQLKSGTAQALGTRIPAKLMVQQVVEADLLLCYITDIKGERDRWFPVMLVYTDHTHRDFYRRLKSENFFNKVKAVFDVQRPSELSNVLLELKRNSADHLDGSPYGHLIVAPVYEVIDPLSLGSQR